MYANGNVDNDDHDGGDGGGGRGLGRFVSHTHCSQCLRTGLFEPNGS
jgi:hypothetical protein